MRDEIEPAGGGRSLFGQLLRDFRIAARLSQEALAERAGLSAAGISVLERGARRSPHRDTVSMLAAALELSKADQARLQAATVRPAAPRRHQARRVDDERIGVHNLPLSLTSFYGRERESLALKANICEQRLVTLVGIGGVGKTRLALETVQSFIERFSDGVWYVELAPVSDPDVVAQRVASTLEFAVRYSGAESSTAWVAQLVSKQMLIVLDNCEHLLDNVAAVAELILERCPRIHVLATSREALRIRGEYVFRVDPLEVPAASAGQPLNLSDLRASPAIRLFLDRAQHIAPAPKLEDSDAALLTLAELCARLDGLPFAIELAAARMNVLTPAMLVRALDGRFHLLTTGARTALPRHRTLQALIDWSYGLLSDHERRVFRRVAVFSGGWTLEAAEAVGADDAISDAELLAILSSLVNKSLLVVTDQGPDSLRYGMLETTRAYALDRLASEDDRNATERRHAEYFSDLLSRNNATWGTVPMQTWLIPLEFELDNLRAALRWSLVARHDVTLGATIAVAQETVLELLSLAVEGCRWCEHALAVLPPDALLRLEAPLQLALARFYARECYFDRAIAAGTRSADLYRARPDSLTLRNLSARACLASALSFTGWAFTALRRYDEADRVASEAAALARKEPDVTILGWALIVKSLSRNDIAAHRSLLDEALVMSRSLPPGYSTEGLARIGLSLVEFDAGNLGRARTLAVEAADHFRRSGLHEYLATWALTIAATSAYVTGDLDGAVAHARDGLSLFRGVGMLSPMNSVQVIASVLAARGRRRDAARLIGGCEAALAERNCPRPNYAELLYERSIATLRQGESDATVDAWLAEGQAWSYEGTIAAALEFERRSWDDSVSYE